MFVCNYVDEFSMFLRCPEVAIYPSCYAALLAVWCMYPFGTLHVAICLYNITGLCNNVLHYVSVYVLCSVNSLCDLAYSYEPPTIPFLRYCQNVEHPTKFWLVSE